MSSQAARLRLAGAAVWDFRRARLQAAVTAALPARDVDRAFFDRVFLPQSPN